jgi:DNA helicase IV
MTLVGDVAQTGARDGAGSWAEVLSPYVAARWRREALTVNYRTPAEIMAVAADVLAVIDPGRTPPSSVRETGVPPEAVAVPAEDGAAADAAVDRARRAAADVVDAEGAGRVAVLAPAARVDAVRARLGAAGAAGVAGVGVDERGATDLEVAVVASTVGEAKGLEFDAVVLLDPEGIVEESPRGLNDLYVALTRATRSLAVLHPGRLPQVLSRLAA